MLIAPAYAQSVGTTSPTDLLTSLAPMLVIVGIFYLLLIRPQQKKSKEHKAKLAGIRRGDKIVTGGGLIGTVSKVVGDNELTVEIAQGVRVNVIRSTVAEVLSKPEPAARDTAPAEPGQAKN